MLRRVFFKGRNEDIAYFAHKGIEASKDWLLKAREKPEEGGGQD